ncbi:MAG TPA: autotransporter, partial [Burkholderiaceae bacterium]|nr:autotransporter [Burkholderiaceae bacterium]
MRLTAVALGVAALTAAGCANRSDPSALPPPTGGWDASGPATAPAPASASSPVIYDSSQAAPAAAQASAAAAPANAPPPAPADPWPRDVTVGTADALIYQPQVESWKGNALAWRVAVALRPAGQKDETFGVVWGTARTDVDKTTRTVELNDVAVTRANFPTLPDKGAQYVTALRPALATALQTMALDSLQASLAASQTTQPTRLAVRNEPPKVIVAYGPALLVPIEGKAVVRQIGNTRFERVINTQAMLARTRFGNTWYLHVYDGWMSSNQLTGPWTQAGPPPPGLDDEAKALAKSGAVDLLDGGEGATPKPTLANGVPAIYVTEAPTELIVFKGQPNLVPVTGTPLLWATNSATDVIVDTTDNAYYVLMAGRWFRAPQITGPWTFVASTALPPSFKEIPAKGTPASIVLASVAGTPQAQEAVIANSIPQTAAVSRAGGPTFTPVFDGAPQWQPVAGTPLRYVANSKVPVIQVNPSAYYAVTGGVWFNATALTGPWVVATSVPAVIYTIPVASPLHYVTYVDVYGFTDSVVYTGYTPGYLGTVVDVGGTVVYGTGYAYSPWIGTVWYGAPVTYGVAAMPVYNPYVGFTFGFAMGMTAAYWAEPYWGGAYYHAGYYGYPCCGSASANVYRSWPGGVSSGTRTYWADNGGAFGTTAAGNYATYRGTTGSYNAQRSWNPYTGQGA